MKNLVWIASIGLALTLTACNKDSTPKASTISSYSGTVVEPSEVSIEFILASQPWTGGSGTVEGYMYSNDAATRITSGPLKSDGSFSIDLPVPPENSLEDIGKTDDSLFVDSSKCSSNSLRFSDTNARISPLELRAVTATGNPEIKNVTSQYKQDRNGINAQAGILLYSDRDFTMTGSAICSAENGLSQHIIYKAHFKKGWNKALIKTTTSNNPDGQPIEVEATFSSGSLASNQWYAGIESGIIPFGLKGLAKVK